MRLNMLSEVIDHVEQDAKDMKVVVDPEDWSDMIRRLCDSGISYEETRRVSTQITSKNGRRSRLYFCVWVTRTCHGMYEYGVNT